MTKLLATIKDLLFDHECVIIPNFGGFVSQYLPAQIDPVTGYFSPPSKTVIFNKSLTNNDGLLANALTQKYEVNFNQANEIIKLEVMNLRKTITQKGQFDLEGLGLFYLEDNQIKFKKSTENFLTDSYGLPILQIGNFKGTTSESSKVISLPTQNLSRNKYWWAAAVLVPFVFYSAWIPLKTNLFNTEGTFHYSDLNPFTFTKQKKYTPKEVLELTTFDLPKVEIKELLVKELPKTTVTPEKEIKKVSKEKAKVKNFHVIVGCFGKSYNAKKLIKKLNKNGYPAYELDVHKKLHRVSLSSFLSKTEALDFKKEASQKGISSWILNK